MKKSVNYFIIGLIVIGLFSFVNIENKSFSDSYIQVLIHAKEYTLEVAKKMPADQYNFRPTDSVRTFGEQMAHLAMANKMMITLFIKGEKMDIDPVAGKKMEVEIGASKEECLKILENSFDYAIQTLKDMDETSLKDTFVFMFSPDKPEYTKEEGYNLLRDHITHHRGQAIIYLRMKGYSAPNYRGF